MENIAEIDVLSMEDMPKQLQFPNDEIRILTATQRMFDLFGCRHQWGFPQTTIEMHDHYVVVRFDSHQTCTVCGRQRFFNFDTMEAGPMFQKRAQL